MAIAETRPRRRRMVWLAGAGLVTAAVLVGLAIAGLRPGRALSWPEIERAAQAKRWPEVERGLTSWIAAHPEDDSARLMQGMTLTLLEKPDAARASLEAVAERSPHFAAAQNLLGDQAMKEHRAADAERHFRNVARLDKAALPPRQRLIYLLSLQQRTAEAREVLWEIAAITRDPRTLIDLVRELYAVEDDVRGVPPELDEFLAQTPADPFLRRARGISWLKEGRAAEALPHLEAAAAVLTDDPTGRFALAECRLLLGRFDGDTSILGPTPEAPTEAARWWVLKSRLEEAMGREADAVASLNRAVEVFPDDRQAHYRLGLLLARAGDQAGAKEHQDRAESLRVRHAAVRGEHDQLRRAGVENSPELFVRLGKLCQEAGLVREARAWFQQAVRLDPLRRDAQEALAGLANTPDAPGVFLARPRRRDTSDPAPAATAQHVPEPAAPGPRFEDIAERSGLVFRYDSGASEAFWLADTMGGGVGLIDYDEDGWLDVYFVNGCPLPVDRVNTPAPNRLFRNQRDGTFEDVTDRAGVGGHGYGMGCAGGDYDGDGHDDLFVTGVGRTVLYRGRGDGTFEDVTDRAGVGSERWTTAAGFADLDADGDLDLVVITYVEEDYAHPRTCRDHAGHPIHCSPKVYPDQQDHLFRNNGDGTFTDVAESAGFVGPDGRGLGLAIADFDDDGRLDIFVANDATANFLFRNLGNLTFEEVGLSAGVAFDGIGRATASMGVVADDLDGDGRIDLFHTNFLNEPNTLRHNLGNGQFVDATLAAGLDAPSQSKTGFGTAALDADNDGRLDLFVANGHVDDQPWVQSPMPQLPQLFLGRPGGRFVTAGAEVSPYFDRPVVGRGTAAGDLDNDGRIDLVIVHRDAPAALLHNVTPHGGHWLGLKLRPITGSPVGARVSCWAGGREMVRWVTPGTSYLSANDPRLAFGLGTSSTVERLEVTWPSGHRQTWTGVAANQFLTLREGEQP